MRVMHCLTGTFLQQISAETDPETDQELFPLRIVLPPNKSRIIYFES